MFSFLLIKPRSVVHLRLARSMHSVKSFAFWDMQCSVPKNGDPSLVYNFIGSALEALGIESPRFVRAYANFLKVNVVPLWTQKCLRASGVDLMHSPSSQRRDILIYYENDILKWVKQNPPPANLFLITDDTSLGRTIQYLRREKYNVMLACNNLKGNKLLSKGCTLCWPWAALAKGTSCTPVKFNEVLDATLYPSLKGRLVGNRDHYEKGMKKTNSNRQSTAPTKAPSTVASPPAATTVPSTAATISQSKDVIGDVAPTKYHPFYVISEVLNFEEEITYCRTRDEVESLLTEFAKKTKACDSQQVLLGLDAEWKPFRKGEKPNKVAVIQLCFESDRVYCYVLHLCHSGVPLALKALLENKSYLKVGLCIKEVAKKIENDYDVKVYPIKDIADLAYAKFGKSAKNWGLAYLTEVVLGKKLEKPANIRLSNWEVEILNTAQLQYAATDAYASLYVYKGMNNKQSTAPTKAPSTVPPASILAASFSLASSDPALTTPLSAYSREDVLTRAAALGRGAVITGFRHVLALPEVAKDKKAGPFQVSNQMLELYEQNRIAPLSQGEATANEEAEGSSASHQPCTPVKAPPSESGDPSSASQI